MPTAAIVLACAIDLLASRGSFPPVVLDTEAPSSGSRYSAAYVWSGENTIHVVVSSGPFQETMLAERRGRRCGPSRELIMLASILAHEQWHLSHPGDEKELYLQQLTVLQSLGLDLFSKEANMVRLSMHAALARKALGRKDRRARAPAALATRTQPPSTGTSPAVSASSTEARSLGP